jgi:3-isopropylmalate/(R)-2-methylmalate dehydratase large subunit
MTNSKTLFDKVWDAHVVEQELGYPAVLYIDRHLVHEVTSPQAFSALRARGLQVRRADMTFATMDHSTPTLPLNQIEFEPQAKAQLDLLEASCT